MAITLLDLARNSRTEAQAGFLTQVVETSPIMAQLPLQDTGGSLTYKYNKEGKLPESSFRPINAPFNQETKGEFSQGEVNLKIFGNEINIDRQLLDQRTFDGMTQLEKRISMGNRAMAIDLKRYTFLGDSSEQPLEPDGLKSFANRYNQSAATGVDVTTDPIESIFEALLNFDDQMKEFGGATHFIAPRGWLNTVYSRLINANNAFLAGKFARESITIDGPLGAIRSHMYMFDDRPFIPLDTDSQWNDILPQSAAGGTGELYALNANEGGFSLLQKNAPQVYIKPTEIGATYYTEWPIGMVAEHEKSVAISTGWTY